MAALGNSPKPAQAWPFAIHTWGMATAARASRSTQPRTRSTMTRADTAFVEAPPASSPDDVDRIGSLITPPPLAQSPSTVSPQTTGQVGTPFTPLLFDRA